MTSSTTKYWNWMQNWFNNSPATGINKISWIRPLFGVVLFLCLFGCKKEEGPTAGIEVQPVENQLGLLSTDTFEVVCRTRRLDSVRTDGYFYHSVGSYVDPTFGLAKNGFVHQIRLSLENISTDILNNSTVDSVVLAFKYSSYYGELDAQNFYVHQLTEDLNVDSSYFSNHRTQYDPNDIGRLLNHEPDPISNFEEFDQEQPAQLRIPLDSAFGQSLLDGSALTYSSNEEFQKVFKGFRISVDNPSQTVNTGGQMLFDLEDEYSRLLLYYKDPDGVPGVLEYLINDKCATFNTSENDYSGTEVEMALEDPIAGKQNMYIQAMGGVAAIVEVPHFLEIAKDGPVIINRAQFILSMKTGSNARYAPLRNLYPFALTEDDKLFDTPDRRETSYFSPSITDDLTYELNMNRYFQQLLNGEYENHGLMMIELAENYGRSVIPGPEASSTPLKFVVSYTPVN